MGHASSEHYFTLKGSAATVPFDGVFKEEIWKCPSTELG